MRLTDIDKLSEHKFTRESAKSSDYMRGWNDCIDTIIDNAPTVEGEILTKEAYSDLCLRASCDNCIENECEVNGYVCPLYKKYQESKETEKMNNKEALNEALDLAIKALEECAKNAQGDLISRSALKRKFRNVNEGMFQLSRVYELIDNAPTVEPTFGLFKEMLCADCGIPTGEWVYDDTINNWKCSECGETPKTIGYVGTAKFMHDEFKFCNHCGAYMIKEGNND